MSPLHGLINLHPCTYARMGWAASLLPLASWQPSASLHRVMPKIQGLFHKSWKNCNFSNIFYILHTLSARRCWEKNLTWFVPSLLRPKTSTIADSLEISIEITHIIQLVHKYISLFQKVLKSLQIIRWTKG